MTQETQKRTTAERVAEHRAERLAEMQADMPRDELELAGGQAELAERIAMAYEAGDLEVVRDPADADSLALSVEGWLIRYGRYRTLHEPLMGDEERGWIHTQAEALDPEKANAPGEDFSSVFQPLMDAMKRTVKSALSGSLSAEDRLELITEALDHLDDEQLATVAEKATLIAKGRGLSRVPGQEQAGAE